MWIDDIMNDEQVILNSLRWTTTLSPTINCQLRFCSFMVLFSEMKFKWHAAGIQNARSSCLESFARLKFWLFCCRRRLMLWIYS